MLILVFMACQQDFLEVPPANTVSESDLRNSKGVQNLLIGTYSMLLGRSIATENPILAILADPTNWLWGSVLGGEANKGSESADIDLINEIQRYQTLPTNLAVRNKYRHLYSGTSRC